MAIKINVNFNKTEDKGQVSQPVLKPVNPLWSKQVTVQAPTALPTTAPVVPRLQIPQATTNRIQTMKESALEPQYTPKRLTLPTSDKLGFTGQRVTIPEIKKPLNYVSPLTDREKQIALGMIKPTEEERSALQVKLSSTPESVLAQNFFKGASLGITDLAKSKELKQAESEASIKNPTQAIGGQIAGSLLPQALLYKVVNKAIQGTEIGKKLLGSSNAGTKFLASQGAQNLADLIIQSPIEIFNNIQTNKSFSQATKDYAINRGIDVILNAFMGGVELNSEMKKALQTPQGVNKMADAGISQADLNVAEQTGDFSGIKNKLDVFYVNQYGVAGKSLDEVNQPLLSAPVKMDAFTKWRQKNFGGAFGKMSEQDEIALKQLYKEDTGIDLLGNKKERPFVVTKSELANQTQPQPIVSPLKPVETSVVEAQKPITKTLKPVKVTKILEKTIEPKIVVGKESKFKSNTLERSTQIDEIIKKEQIRPSGMDYIPETAKQWDDQAIKNIAEDIEFVKEKIRKANSIEGGTMAHEAALITAKLQKEALKTGDFTEFKKWLNEVAEKTRETARGLKGTDTAWEKSSVSAVNKLNRTVNNAEEQLKKSKPKLKEAMEREYGFIKNTFDGLPNEKEIVQKMVLDLENALKTATGKTKLRMNLQLFAAKQKIKTLSDINSSFDEEYIKKWIKKEYGVPTLEDSDIKNIVKFIEESQNAPTDYLRRVAIGQAKKIISSKNVATLGEQTRGALRISMLLNPKTLITRNPLGNTGIFVAENIKDIPGTIIDKIVSLKTGKRTTSFSLGGLVEQGKGAIEGLDEFAKDIKYKVDTNPTGGQHELVDKVLWKKTERDWKATAKSKDMMNWLDGITRHALQLGDRPFYQAAYRGRLHELKRLGKDISKEESILDARLYALERVFQNDSDISKRLTAIRDQAGVFGYAIAPFTKTPANIMDKIIDYTPVGALKSIKQMGMAKAGHGFDQKLFVDRLARAFTGTGLVWLGGSLYKNGVMTAGYEKDKDLRDVQERAGIKPYAFTDGKSSYTIDWASPVGTLLVIGAEMAKSSKDKKDFIDRVTGGTEAGANAFLNQSFMRGMLDTLSGYSPAAGIASGLLGGTSQFLPTFGGQFAQITDKYVRDTSGGLGDKLISKIPVARQLNLEPKLDVYGKEILANQGRGLPSRIFETFLSPGQYSQNKANAIDTEMLRLYKTTNEKKMIPKLDSMNTKKYSEDDITLTKDQDREFKKRVGQATFDLYSTLIESPTYRTKSDADKVNWLYNKLEKLRDAEAKRYLQELGYRLK